MAQIAAAVTFAKKGVEAANNLLNPKYQCESGHNHESQQDVKQCHQREQDRKRKELDAEAELKRIERERDELKSELKEKKNLRKAEKEKYKEEIERLKEEKKEEIQRLKEEMKEEKLKSANTRSSVCVLL